MHPSEGMSETVQFAKNLFILRGPLNGKSARLQNTCSDPSRITDRKTCSNNSINRGEYVGFNSVPTSDKIYLLRRKKLNESAYNCSKISLTKMFSFLKLPENKFRINKYFFEIVF